MIILPKRKAPVWCCWPSGGHLTRRHNNSTWSEHPNWCSASSSSDWPVLTDLPVVALRLLSLVNSVHTPDTVGPRSTWIDS